MKNAKLILAALAILVALMVVWFVVGVVITIAKVLLVLGVILLAATVVRKFLGKSKPRQLEENDADRELNESLRQLEEIKRRQLIK